MYNRNYLLLSLIQFSVKTNIYLLNNFIYLFQLKYFFFSTKTIDR